MEEKTIKRCLIFAGAVGAVIGTAWGAKKISDARLARRVDNLEKELFGDGTEKGVYVSAKTGAPLFLSNAYTGKADGKLLFSAPAEPNAIHYTIDRVGAKEMVAVCLPDDKEIIGHVRELASGALSYEIFQSALRFSSLVSE